MKRDAFTADVIRLVLSDIDVDATYARALASLKLVYNLCSSDASASVLSNNWPQCAVAQLHFTRSHPMSDSAMLDECGP